MHGLRQQQDQEMLLDLSEEMVFDMPGEEYYQGKTFPSASKLFFFFLFVLLIASK